MTKTRIYKVVLADTVYFVRASNPSQATSCVVKTLATTTVASQDDLINHRDVPVLDAREGGVQLDITEANRDR